jgi:polyhydroxybutyrate depolymerase
MQLPGWLSILVYLGGSVSKVSGEASKKRACLWGHTELRPSHLPQNAKVVYGNHYYHLHVNAPPFRQFLLYTPMSGPLLDRPLPVVILLHMQGFNVLKFGHDRWEGLLSLAAQERFAVIMLLGQNYIFNVGLNLQPNPGQANEVVYLRNTLEHVSRSLCIDEHRIFCVGLSNGGRLCQHFVSDFHDVSFAAVGIISAVRYPYPNHNLRPVPMIAFHGMDDTCNRYWGGGAPYWGQESVPQAIEEWSQFNGCQRTSASERTSGVVIYRHTQCTDGADVMLVSIEGGGHTWPFLSMNESRRTFRSGIHKLPVVYINVTQMLWRFFLEHGAADLSLHTDSISSPINNSLAFKGKYSSAFSKSQVQRGVDMAARQLPESAAQAHWSLSRARTACIVTLLALITTALVSATMFFFFFYHRLSKQYNYTRVLVHSQI